mgnify:CR=1 FL=1
MITQNLKAVKAELGTAKLVAVTKNKSIDEVKEIYDAGQLDLGENRVQELLAKQSALPQDIRWHLIGHLQSNKVKYIAPFITMIQSVDSVKLAKEINKQALKLDRKIDILLQIHIAEEESKFGFDKNEIVGLIKDQAFDSFENLRICGLMGMATNSPDQEKVEAEFLELKGLLESVQNLKPEWTFFTELSMGMSQDCHIAVSCGSTMVRIGSKLFL